MESEIAFSHDGGPVDVEVTVTGVPTPQELQQVNARLVGDSEFRAGLTLLVDMSALETAALNEDQLQALSETMVERDWEFPPAAVALIAPDDDRRRAATTYRAHLGGSKSKREVFASRDDAVAWLAQLRR